MDIKAVTDRGESRLEPLLILPPHIFDGGRSPAETLKLFVGVHPDLAAQHRGASLYYSTGTPIDASKLTQRRLQPLLKRLGIGRAGLHAFRHTGTSLRVEQGISMRIAQQQLGHSDLRITLAIYSHVIGDLHRQAVEKLSSVLDFWWPQLATNDDEQKVKGQLI